MIRHAKVTDSEIIQKLVNSYAKKGEMLTLSLNEIFERLYEFILYEEDGLPIGVCALHPMWGDVAEIRSLAVKTEFTSRGIGLKMVEYMLNRAREMGFKEVFALTYRQGFFEKAGFHVTDIESLPKKLWTDCLKCVKYPNCDETAVIVKL